MASDEPVVPEEHEVEEPVILGAPEELGGPEADGPEAGAPAVGVLAVGVDAILAADVPVVDEKPVATEVGMAKGKPSVPPTG